MRTHQPKHSRSRAAGAAACAILLCGAMVAGLASLGTNNAHAEGSAVTSETITTPILVGYYASGKNNKIDGSGDSVMSVSGSQGYDNGGNLVPLSGLDLQGSSAYIAADDLDVFLSSSNLKIYSSIDGSLGPGISWYTLYKMVAVEKPVDPSPTTPDRSGTVLPEIGNDRESPDASNKTSKPEEGTKPTQPANPDSSTSRQPDLSPTDSPILSLQCHRSEVDVKVAELESQGYEIVGIQEVPYWIR